MRCSAWSGLRSCADARRGSRVRMSPSTRARTRRSRRDNTCSRSSAGFVFAPRLATVFSARYQHRVSLGSADDRPDISEGTLEAAVVQRFGNGTWLRALPAVVIDYEHGEDYVRLDGEWGRVLTGGMSTWVRAGRAFGSDSSRRYDWSLVIGFRFVG